MKDICWKLFSYLVIDHQAAQDLLNEMAEKGWALDLLVLNQFARFRRTERTDLRYDLDWADPRQVEDPDYIRMCAESGWHIKDELGYWNLYESLPGFSPAPIQTDPELEYQRFRKKVLRRSVISGIASVGGLLLLLGLLFALLRDTGPFRWTEFLLDALCRSISLTFAFIFLPFLSAAGLFHLGVQLRRIRLWKQALRQGEAPVFSRKTAEICKWTNFSFLCLAILLFLSLLADALINADASWTASVAAIIAGFWVMSNSDIDRTKFQMGLLTVALGASLLLAIVFHQPFRELFPGRFPAQPGERVFSLTDAPFGSRKWGTGLPLSEPEPYWYDARIWTIPGLSRQAAQEAVRSRGMLPVEGQEGVWVNGDRYLLLRGNTLLELLVPEDAPGLPYEEIRAWMDRA